MNFLKNKKGFTLIELLVVIGILAVLAAGIVSLIDPVDKNNAAQDAKVQSDLGQIATAMQSYAATDPAGLYPTTGTWQTVLPAQGHLTVIPTAPTGYAAYTWSGTVLCGQLKSKKYTGATTPRGSWRWETSSGKACPSSGTTCTTACP